MFCINVWITIALKSCYLLEAFDAWQWLLFIIIKIWYSISSLVNVYTYIYIMLYHVFYWPNVNYIFYVKYISSWYLYLFINIHFNIHESFSIIFGIICPLSVMLIFLFVGLGYCLEYDVSDLNGKNIHFWVISTENGMQRNIEDCKSTPA